MLRGMEQAVEKEVKREDSMTKRERTRKAGKGGTGKNLENVETAEGKKRSLRKRAKGLGNIC